MERSGFELAATHQPEATGVAGPESEAERWRLFIAIELPNPVRKALEEPIRDLALLKDSVRASQIERVHLTLHFLGEQPAQGVPALRQRIGAAVAPRFDLVSSGVGAFPAFSRPQVLWAGIAGPGLDELSRLQARLGKALRELEIAIEDRFNPHLTLARVRRPIRGPARKVLRDWESRWRETQFGSISVDEVRLMRSELGGGPPRYTTVASFKLQ
jgi:2'-5' RNA ligase